MTDPIDRSSRSTFTPFTGDAPEAQPAERSRLARTTDDAPWLDNPAFAAVVSYSPAMLANPTLRGSARSSSVAEAWPTLATFPEMRAAAHAATTRCASPIATNGNAAAFADRQIPLATALKDGAFATAGTLYAVHISLNRK